MWYTFVAVLLILVGRGGACGSLSMQERVARLE